MSDDALIEYLALHPRMIGALATLLLLLTAPGSALARGGIAVAIHGP